MKENTKHSLLYTFPKAIIFALAIANVIFIWSHQKVQTGTTISLCIYCPWYDNWSFTNEPSILFLAALLLLLSKQWSYLIAGLLSGYILFSGLFYTIRAISYFGLLGLWNGIQETESNIFLAIEIQWILAGIIFSFTISYLLQNKLQKNPLN